MAAHLQHPFQTRFQKPYVKMIPHGTSAIDPTEIALGSVRRQESAVNAFLEGIFIVQSLAVHVIRPLKSFVENKRININVNVLVAVNGETFILPVPLQLGRKRVTRIMTSKRNK